MTKRIDHRGRVLAAVLTLLLVGAACGNSGDDAKTTPTTGGGSPTTGTASGDYTKKVPVDAPGVTDSAIRVGSITSKTNPLGGNYGDLNLGIKAYFDTVNADGGLYGRELKLVKERDDAVGNNTTEAEAMLDQDNVYAVFEAVLLFTGASRLEQAGIPTFGWNINAEWTGPKNFFPNNGALCFTCAGHAVPWVAREEKRHRVGILGYNVPQSRDCAVGVKNSFKEYGDAVDAQIVFDDESLSFGQTDFSAQVSQMKAKGVDFLTTCMDYNGDFGVAKEMKKQGILDQVTFSHPNMYDHEFVKKNAANLEGGIVLAQFTAFEHRPLLPAQKEFFDYAEAHGVKVNELSAHGWIAAKQFVDALKATGPNFTWKNLIDTWNKQTFYSADGWIQPIDWTKQHRDPLNDESARSQFECGNYLRIRNGKFESIYGEPGKPWVCFDGRKPVGEWQEPVKLGFQGEPFDIADVQK
jgi:branched-chain amino acid transport system substrate-binding protein